MYNCSTLLHLLSPSFRHENFLEAVSAIGRSPPQSCPPSKASKVTSTHRLHACVSGQSTPGRARGPRRVVEPLGDVNRRQRTRARGIPRGPSGCRSLILKMPDHRLPSACKSTKDAESLAVWGSMCIPQGCSPCGAGSARLCEYRPVVTDGRPRAS